MVRKSGRIVRRQYPEGYVLVEPLGDSSGRCHPDAVAVEQHLDHHPWMIRWPASTLAIVAGDDLRQVQLVHDVRDEVSQMAIR